MSVLADYSEADRILLRRSLAAAAIFISASSPGRKEETVSEGYAAAEFVLRSQPQYVGNTLVTSIIVWIEQRLDHEQPFPDFVDVASSDGARDRAIETLRGVVPVLDGQATPEEAAGYKGWLMEIARVVARAGKEDQGFLGRGGVQVNDVERAALEELAELLGTERA
jgi:hypothetical protein